MSKGSKGKGRGKKKGKKDGRGLRLLSRVGISRGFMGGSRTWTLIASFTIAIRLLKRIFGGTPETVYSETLRPGDCLIIAHDREARVVRAPS